MSGTGTTRSDPRTRLAEIRQENYRGDVSAKDIWWLIDVAAAALAVLDYENHPSRSALSGLREELHRV